MTQINKLVAGPKGAAGNSRGVDVANSVNQIIDRLEELGNDSGGGQGYFGNTKFLVDLKSLGTNFKDAMQFAADYPQKVEEYAAHNQLLIEVAIGTRTPEGIRIPDEEVGVFNVELPEGYFPIMGDIDLPPSVGKFKGQGAFKRRKHIGFNGAAVLEGIEEYPTCLMPIWGSNKSGLLTRCSSSEIGRFAIVGSLKKEGDGGHGVIEGHTPPIPEFANATSVAGQAPSMSNPYTQNRFGEPKVYSDLTTFVQMGNDTEITLPELGSYNDQYPIIKDDTADIPLVRWVRAYNADGTEIKRWANLGWSLKPDGTNDKIIGINDENRMCTSRPLRDSVTGDVLPEETRVYHKPFTDQDTNTVVVVPGGLPADTVKVEVSLYNLIYHKTYEMLMMPYLSGAYSQSARAQGNEFKNIMVHDMPWNGWMLVDGIFNTHDSITTRYCGLDGWHAPSGYEDYMHSTFRACTAINNKGWGFYMRETEDCSRSSLDSKKWPTADGKFETHRKWTYWAANLDFTNFDLYGNRGGAYYFGTASVNISAGAMEYHFDAHNVDPFGTSSRKALADWNPVRWIGCVIFGPMALQNTITVSGSPTDARRNTFCVWRNPNETPAPTNPDSNIMRAIDRNYYIHPRTDSYGSLVETHTKAISRIAFTQNAERTDAAGDNGNDGGDGILELHGAWSNRDTFLFQPHLYSVSPKANFSDDKMHVVFSAKDPDIDNAAEQGAVTLSADQIGIAGQNNFTTLYKGEGILQMNGRTIPAGGKYRYSGICGTPAGMDLETVNTDDLMIQCSVNFNQDFYDETGTYPLIDTNLVVGSPQLRKYRNANGEVKLGYYLDIFNPTATDVVYPEVDTRHRVVYVLTGYDINRVL